MLMKSCQKVESSAVSGHCTYAPSPNNSTLIFSFDSIFLSLPLWLQVDALVILSIVS